MSEHVCKKCGGSDFREGRGRCWTCKLRRRRERYLAFPDKYREINAANARIYREKNREKMREYGKVARIKSLARNPHCENKGSKVQYQIARHHIELIRNRKIKQRANIILKSKSDLSIRLASLESAFKKLKEICMSMSNHATFQIQAKSMTTEELFAEFSACTVRVSEGLYRMAVIWIELENRGQDLSLIKTPFRQFFPDLASGKLLPDIALEYGGSPKKVELFAKLLPEDQQKLVGENATVPLAVRGENGEIEVKQVNPIEMRLSEARQVFGEGRIRTPEEQARFVPKPEPARATPAIIEAEPSLEDFDLLAILSHKQCGELAALAKQRKMTPAAFVVDLLIRTKAITPTAKRLVPGKVRSFADIRTQGAQA